MAEPENLPKQGKDSTIKNEAPKEIGHPPVKWIHLFKYATGKEKLLLVVAFLMSATNGAMMPLLSILYGQVAEDLADNKPAEEVRDTATKTALNMFFVGLGAMVSCFIASFLWSYVGLKLVERIKILYFTSIMNQEMAWFDKANPEMLTTTYVEDLQKFKMSVGFSNHTIVQSIASAVLGFLAGYIYGWIYALIITAIYPIIMAGMVVFVIVSGIEIKKSKKAYLQAGSLSEQALGGVKTVKSLCGEDHEVSLYYEALNAAKKVSLKYSMIAAFSYGMFMFCFTGSYGLNYLFGTLLIHDNRFNHNSGEDYRMKDIITIFYTIINGGFALGNASPAMKSLGFGKEAARAIYSIIERKSKIVLDNPEGIKPDSIEGEIVFKDVHFAYPTRLEVPVHRGINLTVPKGKKVAFVGETGCGKSTSVQLIERYYDVLKGEITIDGVDIRKYNLEALRKHISYVGQEPVLFACTIRENMLIAKPDATEMEIQTALKRANAFEFVMNLEDKIDTYVGSGGSQISGGQKQRIAIARAILQNPTILLLDEATSALDMKNEREIQATLDSFSDNRTTITIAHRLSTVINSDIIYVFEKGLIAEYGSHEELLKNNGLYKQLVSHQLENAEKQNQVKNELSNLPHLQAGATDIGEDPESQQEKLRESVEDLYVRIHHPESHIVPPQHGGDCSVTDGVHAKRLETENLNPEELKLVPKASSHSAKTKQSIHEEMKKKKQMERKLSNKKRERASKRLREYLKGNYLSLFIACFFALGAGCVMPFFAFFLSDQLTILMKYEVIRAGFGEKHGYEKDDLLKDAKYLTLKFFLVAIYALLANFCQLGFFSRVAQNVTMSIRTKLYKHFLYRDMSFFDNPKNSPGILSSVLAKDCLTVNTIVSTTYGAILSGVGSFICGLIIAFIASWKLAFIGVIIGPLSFISGNIKTGTKKKAENDGEDEHEESAIFQEHVTNMRTVLSLNSIPHALASFKKALIEDDKNEVREILIEASLETLANVSQYMTYALVFWVGSELRLRDGLSFNDFYKCFLGIFFASYGASMAQQFAGNIREAKEASAKIFEFLDQENEIVQKANPITKDIIGEIEFQNVKFKYPQRETNCFENLNMKIHPKQKVAFAGPSGTGKSTIFGLLYRFYEPQEGRILIDGVDIKDYDIKHLRKAFGMVGQEPVLFNSSIRYNVRYNQPSITEEEIRQAAETANAMNFIEKDVKAAQEANDTEEAGFGRSVGLKGNKLSGGQKQRVAIARTVVRKPIIYMFDEATSALDTESEKIVQEAINHVSAGQTSLTIAHRISTIKDSDVIFVIDQGKVAEQDTYDGLMNSKGLFYHLTKAH